MNKANRSIVVLFAILINLTGCAGSNKLADDTQRLEARQQQIAAKMDELEKEMAQWQQMKPGVARLVVIENDLKELIVQLNTIVDESASEPEPKSKSPKPEAMPVKPSPVIPQPVKPVAVASKTVVQPTQSQQQTANTEIAIPTSIIAPTKPAKQASTPQITAAAYPSAPEQPVEYKPSVPAKYALQLSSVSNPALITSSWQGLQKKYATVLTELTPTYERARVNGRTYFRIKVGRFHSRKQAKQACTQLKNIGGPCVVTLNNGVSYDSLDKARL